MDRDRITRTGARTPGVERKTARMEVLTSTSRPDTEQGTSMEAESTKDDGKPVGGEGLVGYSSLEAVLGKTRRTEF